MKEDLYRYLATQGGNMTIQDILVCFAAAVIIGMVIFVSYRFSHSSTVYSAKFNVSLVMITIVTTLIMAVIGNNVALSLGMVGALSIVRFRTAIKDPRDTAYIFWCIAAGVCCGIQDFAVAAIGSATVFIVMLLLGNVGNNERYLLIIHGKGNAEDAINGVVREVYGDRVSLRVANMEHEHTELIYELTDRVIRKAEKNNPDNDVRAKLMELDDVSSVSLVCQNDEITR